MITYQLERLQTQYPFCKENCSIGNAKIKDLVEILPNSSSDLCRCRDRADRILQPLTCVPTYGWLAGPLCACYLRFISNI